MIKALYLKNAEKPEQYQSSLSLSPNIQENYKFRIIVFSPKKYLLLLHLLTVSLTYDIK